jgi:DNA-binding response OmpR family regulator
LKQRILVVDDEPRIVSFLEKGLKSAGYEVVTTAKGKTAVTYAVHGDFDLIILDIGLPDIDGFSVLEQLRGQGVTTPVIMLTARSSAVDAVAGLTKGADDYMTKPFAFEELLARIPLRIKPGNELGAAILTHRDLSLDLTTRKAVAAGRSIDLSAREFEMAKLFLQHPGQILSREQILTNVWGIDFDPGSNVVDVYLRYLRRKLGTHRFETVRGMGYRLV